MVANSDFLTGEFNNLSRNITRQYMPLDAKLREIIQAGGWAPSLEKRLSNIR